MIAQMLGVALPRASGSKGNGRFSRNVIVLSSGADSSSVRAISACPSGSRTPQRRMLATQSRASTFCPSWKTTAIIFHSLPCRHLGYRLEAALRPGHTVEGIENEVAVTAGDASRGQD